MIVYVCVCVCVSRQTGDESPLISRNLPQQPLETISSRFDLMRAQNKKSEWDKSDVWLNPNVFHLSFLPVVWLSALIEMD